VNEGRKALAALAVVVDRPHARPLLTPRVAASRNPATSSSRT
jgi:hypothetical protein